MPPVIASLRSAGLASLCVVLLAVAGGAGLLAQSAVFVPGGDLDLLVGGTLDPEAKIYELPGGDAALLVVSERLPSAILIHVRSRGVQAVPTARLRPVGDGLTIERGDALAGLGTFELEGTDVHITHGAVAVILRPKPSLVGAHTLEELYQHTPRYRFDADAYVPDPDILAKLREAGKDYRVKVVFGSWCSVCKHYLPRGLAVANALGDASIRFEYLGLPLEDPWHDPEVARLGVKSLPTAIVYRGDKEIGRFAGGEGWEQPEARLWDAIARAK